MWHNKLRNTNTQQAFNTWKDGNRQCALTVIYDGDDIKAYRNSRSNTNPYINCKEQDAHCNNKFTLSNFIIHLNDAHHYTFKQIADIIQPIEEEFKVEEKEVINEHNASFSNVLS